MFLAICSAVGVVYQRRLACFGSGDYPAMPLDEKKLPKFTDQS
jgi:hypothetical protein